MFRIVNKSAQYNDRTFLDEIPEMETPSGFVDDTNYEDYLADEQEQTEAPVEEQPDGGFLDEMPTGLTFDVPTDTPEVEYSDPTDLINAGIATRHVISFEYTNRYGEYAGRRYVEPHYTFDARTTGNKILVTYDWRVSDIRAFIVGNIWPGGVLYKSNDFTFSPRQDIMQGVLGD